jgi:hypothetical protein
MSKLIFTALTPLDGYIEAENARFDWAVRDAEVHTFGTTSRPDSSTSGGSTAAWSIFTTASCDRIVWHRQVVRRQWPWR